MPGDTDYGVFEIGMNHPDEIRPLVTLCIGPDLEAVGSTQRLAGKIMSNDPRDRMEALRETLRLAPDDYQEGVFCWKGFLYYKWILTSLRAEVAGVADAQHQGLGRECLRRLVAEHRAAGQLAEGIGIGGHRPAGQVEGVGVPVTFVQLGQIKAGEGLGASHQTGWTGGVASLMHYFATHDQDRVLERGPLA